MDKSIIISNSSTNNNNNNINVFDNLKISFDQNNIVKLYDDYQKD